MAKTKTEMVNCPLCEMNGEKIIDKVTPSERNKMITKFGLKVSK